MLFPSVCLVCGALGPSPCATCVASMVPASAFLSPRDLDSCAALLSYEGAGRQLVSALKYRNRRAGIRAIATAMADLVDPSALTLVTWAPTSAVRRRRRGYDQSELLARSVARVLGRPCRRRLGRSPGPAQTGRTRAERAAGVAFGPKGHVDGAVLVIDDVLTTGATLRAAAAALRAAGAAEVHGLVLAATPPPDRGPTSPRESHGAWPTGATQGEHPGGRHSI